MIYIHAYIHPYIHTYIHTYIERNERAIYERDVESERGGRMRKRNIAGEKEDGELETEGRTELEIDKCRGRRKQREKPGKREAER